MNIVVRKKGKKHELSIVELLDQLERLRTEINRIQSSYQLYQSNRMAKLGPYFQELREIYLKHLPTLDRLYSSGHTSKAMQREISLEIGEIYEYIELNFTLTEEEIDEIYTLIKYHTGIEIRSNYDLQTTIDENQDPNTTEQAPQKDRKQTKGELEEQRSIKSIYKELMKHYHPDRNTSPEAANTAQEVIRSYAEGDLETLLKIYQRTFSHFEEMDENVNMRLKLEQELELLQLQYDEMIRKLGTDQQMTEKSALKKIKAEGKAFREFVDYQKQLLNLVYTDIDVFKRYRDR